MAYCPQAHPPTAPNPALPYLKGYLNEVMPNVKVTMKDIYACYFSYLFSAEQLEEKFDGKKAAEIRNAYLAQKNINAYKNISEFISKHAILEDALEQISKIHQKETGTKKESLTLHGNTFRYISEYVASSRYGILEAVSIKNRENNFADRRCGER